MTVERTKLVIKRTIRNKILTTKLDSWDGKSINEPWMIYNICIPNGIEVKWYQICMMMIMAMTMRLREAEQLKDEEKELRECRIELS